MESDGRRCEVWNVTVDGRKIQTKEDFIKVMEKEFLFPYSCRGNLDAFLDFMRDLSWIFSERLSLTITWQQDFLKELPGLKRTILECLSEDVAGYWQGAVPQDMTDGRPKKFELYLTDSE